MNYVSTRGGAECVSAAQAIKQGLASDGGLFMPEELPALSAQDFTDICKMDYPHRAAFILSKFLTDYTQDELLQDCIEAYGESRFPGGAAPLADYSEQIKILELWHGPTCAFRDMALQIMPKLLSRALIKTNEKRTALILVATSGDTGKAALEGYRDVDGVKIQVFYPVNGVSKIQKKQMATQEGNNVDVCAIKGNFDDAQNGVKRIFADKAFAGALNECGYFLSSANSINWGRLAPQIVYYISAYCDMVMREEIKMGDPITVCVPTGNFGNIFAAFLAKQMGLPLSKLICASNKNNILTDFLRTGVYDRNRQFYTTMSPSMDILISSNLERLLYLSGGAEQTADYMKLLKETGRYEISAQLRDKLSRDFVGYYCSEEQTRATIHDAFANGYLCDTHTAVALKCALEYARENASEEKILVASTASPYKFATSVLSSISDCVPADEFDTIDALMEKTGTRAPAPLAVLRDKKVRFENVVEAECMQDAVLAFAKS